MCFSMIIFRLQLVGNKDGECYSCMKQSFNFTYISDYVFILHLILFLYYVYYL